MSNDPSLRDMRDDIVTAALVHVPFDGFTRKVLREGARDAGYAPELADTAFRDGIAQAAEHLADLGDRRMAEALAAIDLDAIRFRERVALAIRTRLSQWEADKEALRHAVGALLLPNRAARSARALYRTADAIWYAVGDRSTDFSFYTKRASLSGVYASTLMYWLNDRSEDSADSWAFLDRRIDDVMRIPKLRARVEGALGAALRPVGTVRDLVEGTRRQRG